MAIIFSVIMNCRNGEEFLVEAIDSVLAQSYPNWELIFWDNQSTDQTAEIVEKYQDSRIKYYRSETFQKLGEARESAIKKATGEFIAFLDSDDRWVPHKLERMIPIFNDPKVGIGFSNCMKFAGNGFNKLIYTSPKDYAEGSVFYRLLDNYFLNLQTVVIRVEALQGLEYIFDKNLELAEEADLFLRVAHDWSLSYVDEVLAEYRIHKKSDSFLRTELFVSEIEKIIKNLEYIYPSEVNKINMAARGMLDTAHWGCAVSDLLKGENKSSRKHIMSIIKKQNKQILFYFGTFLPGKVFLIILYSFGLLPH